MKKSRIAEFHDAVLYHIYNRLDSKRELYDKALLLNPREAPPLSQETMDRMIEKIKDNSLKEKDWRKK